MSINLQSPDLIQSLIRRKGGTKVSLGHHAAMKRNYHFKPVDPSDPDSAHVADVTNEDDYAVFIAASDIYRRYKAGQPPVIAVASVDPEQQQNLADKQRNRYDDLLSISNVESLSNEWLEGFARDVLDVPITNRADLMTIANDYGLTFKGNTATMTITRKIVEAMIAEQQRASSMHGSGLGDDLPENQAPEDQA